MKDDVIDYIRTCTTCQMIKTKLVPSPRLLQPLPIPTETWCSVSIYFITGLPEHIGKEVVMVVVDRLTKYAHFIELGHPYTVFTFDQSFLYNIYIYHGLPTSIVNDRDLVLLDFERTHTTIRHHS
jgi:hypothetical protein